MHSKIRVMLRSNKYIDEGRTLPVSADFVDSIDEQIKNIFIDLIKAQLKETIDGCKEDIANSQAALAANDAASEAEKLKFANDLKTAKKDIDKNKRAITVGMKILKMFNIDEKNIDNIDISKLQRLKNEVIVKDGTGKEARSLTVAEVSLQQFLKYVTESNIKDTIIKGRMNDAEFEAELADFFAERKVNKVVFNIQLIKKGVAETDYAGRYHGTNLMILITIDASMFMTFKIIDSNGKTQYMSPIISADNLATNKGAMVIDSLQIVSQGFKSTIRHEIQHLVGDVYARIIGTKNFFGLPNAKAFAKGLGKKYDENGIALDPLTGMRMVDSETDEYIMYIDPATGRELPHHLLPIEASTNAQDAIDEFADLVKSRIYPAYAQYLGEVGSQREYINTVNYFIKQFIGNKKFSARTEALPDNIDPSAYKYFLYFKPSIYFMKLIRANPQLWKWSARKLFDHMTNVIKSQIQQSKKDKK
jgi:hypothetical protein